MKIGETFMTYGTCAECQREDELFYIKGIGFCKKCFKVMKKAIWISGDD